MRCDKNMSIETGKLFRHWDEDVILSELKKRRRGRGEARKSSRRPDNDNHVIPFKFFWAP